MIRRPLRIDIFCNPSFAVTTSVNEADTVCLGGDSAIGDWVARLAQRRLRRISSSSGSGRTRKRSTSALACGDSARERSAAAGPGKRKYTPCSSAHAASSVASTRPELYKSPASLIGACISQPSLRPGTASACREGNRGVSACGSDMSCPPPAAAERLEGNRRNTHRSSLIAPLNADSCW